MMPYAKKRSRSYSSSAYSAYKKPRQSRRSTYRASRTPRRTTTVVYQSGGELKGVDTSLDVSYGVDSTTGDNSDIILVNAPVPGTASYNRIGRKIKMESLRIRGFIDYRYVNSPSSGDVDSNAIRITVVYDKQPSEVLPKFDEIFGSTFADAAETSIITDNLRYDNTNRFKVISDETMCLNPQLWNGNGGTTDTTFQKYFFDKYIKLKGKITVFSGQSAPTTIADISSGGLYVVFRADRDSANASNLSITKATARLRFYDG